MSIYDFFYFIISAFRFFQIALLLLEADILVLFSTTSVRHTLVKCITENYKRSSICPHEKVKKAIFISAKYLALKQSDFDNCEIIGVQQVYIKIIFSALK